MNLSTVVSSVVVGLIAGLLGPIVAGAISAMRAVSRLGQDDRRTTRISKKGTSTYARPGADAPVIVRMPKGRRRDRGFDECHPAA
jgi:hypothetical protein